MSILILVVIPDSGFSSFLGGAPNINGKLSQCQCAGWRIVTC
jgi:hypothetical protein